MTAKWKASMSFKAHPSTGIWGVDAETVFFLRYQFFFLKKTGAKIRYFRITFYRFYHKAKAPPLKKKKLIKYKDMRMIDIQGTVPHIENFVYSSAIASRKSVTDSIVVAKFNAKNSCRILFLFSLENAHRSDQQQRTVFHKHNHKHYQTKQLWSRQTIISNSKVC